MKIPIHKHSPVRRRPSVFKIFCEPKWFINGIPIVSEDTVPTGKRMYPIVHTGTTKVEKKYNAEPGHYGPYRLCDPEEQLKWDMLEASIEVHKRPNILKKLLKKVRKYVK